MVELRSRRLLLRVVLHGAISLTLLGVVLVAVTLEAPGLAGLVSLALLVYLATLRVNPLPRLVERSLLQREVCSACGAVFDLMGTWACGCGFVSWHPRHVLSPCPNCGRTFSFVECPNCAGGIRV